MFSTLSEYLFGTAVSSPTNVQETLPSGQGHPDPEPECDWVIVKNEVESFLLSSEHVTRNRVNLQEDLFRENFLIENPLSLSSEDIDMKVIKIDRKSRRRAKLRNPRTRFPVSNLKKCQFFLMSNQDDQSGSHNDLTSYSNPNNPRALTLLSVNNNNNLPTNQTLRYPGDRRRFHYHYQRHSGVSNDRKMSSQRKYSNNQ